MIANDTAEPVVVHNGRGNERSKKPKRFQCSLCQRLFGRLEHLQRHERTHSQDRPFACARCESRFTRSDLLIRHQRLSHDKNKTKSNVQQQVSHVPGANSPSPPDSDRAAKRQRVPNNGSYSTSPSAGARRLAVPSPGHADSTALNRDSSLSRIPVGPQQSPLATLSLAAEQSALRDVMTAPSIQTGSMHVSMPAGSFGPAGVNSLPQADPIAPPAPSWSQEPLGLQESFDNFAAFLDTGPISSYHFASLGTTEQLMPFFSPEYFRDFGDQVESLPDQPPLNVGNGGQDALLQDESNSFSRFGSRLPSLQAEERPPNPHSTNSEHNPRPPNQYENLNHCETAASPRRLGRVSDVSQEDYHLLLSVLPEFTTLPPSFRAPSKMSLARYIRAYIDGFHEHLPFLHIPTMSVRCCAVELILAMAAVGAQYCFEAEQGLELFHAARAVATERIRKRDARVALIQNRQGSMDLASSSPSYGASNASLNRRSGSLQSHAMNGPLGLPSDPEVLIRDFPPREDLIQAAQALLILMAMATWAKHKEILREALAIQSVLASIVRDDGLGSDLDAPHVHGTTNSGASNNHESWEHWSRSESVLRTKYIVFCFFNLHCIVYDIPPLILNSELKMRLPCSASEFKADSEASWWAAKERANEPSQVQDALRWLFSGSGKDTTKWHSSLGNYVLIHAIIQHIFFVRQTARCRFDSSELTAAEMAPLEQALRNWQQGWERNPESSLDPMDPNGPVAFNSTALLRLAYIRLNMDTGPGRALGTRDPLQIAHALRDIPAINRTPKLMRALLHSAHALSIPIKIGIRLVAKTQTFTWSIQHSLCSLECALLLSKWLEAVSRSEPAVDPPITSSETRIMSLVKTVLDETEFGVPLDTASDLASLARHLNVGVLRVWATIFTGAQTWAIVDVIGTSLNTYADMLDGT